MKLHLKQPLKQAALCNKTSLITLKARTRVPDQCKDDEIGRGMGLCTVTSRLLTRGLSFLLTHSNFARTLTFK